MANINYSDVLQVERLPIDAQDVVTNPTLVIAGNYAGAPPFQRITRRYEDVDDLTGSDSEHIWLPVAHDYAHPDSGGLFSQRAFDLPEGQDPFLAPQDLPSEPLAQVGMENPGSPSAVRDGDPTTYGGSPDLSAAGGALIYNNAPVANTNLIYGWRLVYRLNIGVGTPTLSMPTASPAIIQLTMSSINQSRDTAGYPAFETRYLWGIPATPQNETRVLYAVTAFDARLAYPDNQSVAEPDLYTRLLFLCQPQLVPGGYLQVFEFIPLMLNTTLLDSIAAGNARLPAVLPRRVTVAGVIAPDREHTIVGWPGSDYTGVVAQQQYELGRTIIDFEQAGSPVGLPAEALEAARERRVAIDRAVSDAGYAVRMGERQ